MTHTYKWFTTSAGVKVCEVVNNVPDDRGRVLVRKWRDNGECWTTPMRMPAKELREIPATTGGHEETPQLRRVRRALRRALAEV